MLFTIGDIPAEPLTIDGSELDPSYTAVSAKLISPTGVLVRDLGLHVFDEDGVATVPWGTTSPFETEGVYSVRINAIVLNQSTDVYKALRPLSLVVESATGDGWLTVWQARELWEGAPESDTFLRALLDVARITCESVAPALPAGAVVPVNYRLAQLMQARNQSNAAAASPGDGGDDRFILTPQPLDWNVKALLRPKRGAPSVG